MKKDLVDDIILTKDEQKKFIKELIDGHKKDLLNCQVQESIYAYEYATQKHIGKEKAAEGLAQYQQRIRYLKENIYALLDYAKNHDLL